MSTSDFLFKTYLTDFHYPVDNEMMQRFLSDPDNLVLSITNTLAYFKIKHIVATVPKSSFNQLPIEFIAQVNLGNRDSLVLITKMKDKKVKIQVDIKKSIIIDEDKFLKDWTGFIIAIEKNRNPIKKSRFKNSVLYISLLICVLSVLSYLFLTTSSVLKVTYFLLSMIGLSLSYLILKEKHGHYTFISRYCNLSKHTNCQSVIESKGSKFFNFLDLSAISVVYFSFLILAFVYEPSNVFFFGISVLALPIVVYSIYQQYFKIKKWCPLCLGIASVLVLQFFVILPINANVDLDFSSSLIFVFLLGIITSVWLYIKPLLVLEQKNNKLVIENLSFRRNYHLFIPYYNSLKEIDTESKTLEQIQLGSKTPTIEMVAITNPLCKSCFKAHKVYMDLLDKYPDEIQIKFRFLVPNNDRNNTRTRISERLLQLYMENDIKFFKEAFDDWYKDRDFENWTSKWGNCNDVNYNKILSKQVYWCLKNGIDRTPAVLVNGKLFPETYDPTDIENFIEPNLGQSINMSQKEINSIRA